MADPLCPVDQAADPRLETGRAVEREHTERRALTEGAAGGEQGRRDLEPVADRLRGGFVAASLARERQLLRQHPPGGGSQTQRAEGRGELDQRVALTPYRV